MDTKMIFSAWLISLVLSSACSNHAEEPLLKPIGGDSPVVDGLQVRLKPVKTEFGPGESVLLDWIITNVGDGTTEIELAKEASDYSSFSFEVRHDGRSLDIAQGEQRARPAVSNTFALAPGAQEKRWIDLRSVPWKDQQWLKRMGRFEVRVSFQRSRSAKPVLSAWVAFRIAVPGTPLPRTEDPEEVEKINRLIWQLGADSFKDREDAEKELLKLGNKTLGLLQDALNTTEDAEIRLRCTRLIRHIRGDTPKPPLKDTLCQRCRGMFFTADVGSCRHCRGDTPSGSYVSCHACAAQRNCCAACGGQLGTGTPNPDGERPRHAE